ncbi:symbiosis regulated acidic polypeptide SRAP32-2 [Pisolithus tinctorius]|uniref:Uncharacterized protein n=1 Tax=Pisolithus tinctorius Marx 270 TaxID=870435 RepID=A0A0C3NKH2_PISTI|nr:symbiosis regulated acidic polypeptide SRAP32-2 [Pisolithus tinctorius]KIO01435.1 hypothetical protein M404DRAFT_733724 [Pisolithus tinctorius Marx 270]
MTMPDFYITDDDVVTGRRRFRIKPFGRSSGHEAAIIGGTLLSVLDNLTEQNRMDVANSLEYATHVALQKTTEDEDFEKFWDEYMNCLFSIGWEKIQDEQANLSLDETTSDTGTVCDFVIDNIRNDPLYTEEEKDLVIQGLEIVRNQTSHREFFRRFTVRKSRGLLGVSTASVEDGVLKLRYSGFMFSCNAEVEDYFNTSTAHIEFVARKEIVEARADQGTIDRLRAQIEEELEQASGDYVSGISIATDVATEQTVETGLWLFEPQSCINFW